MAAQSQASTKSRGYHQRATTASGRSVNETLQARQYFR